ncbi:MAG: S8 family peptidase, partial [Alcanivoracaceae bacterium]|nr:S8 family peptidase [Alcanivoracaceae bacterium]
MFTDNHFNLLQKTIVKVFILLLISIPLQSQSTTFSEVPTEGIDKVLVYNSAKVIPNQYIVVLKEQVVEQQVQTLMLSIGNFSEKEAKARVINDMSIDLATRAQGSLERIYTSALNGFVLKSSSRKAVSALANDSRVAFIEADQMVSIGTTQNNATWGLDRIDQVNLPLNSTYIYNQDGTGVTAYIVDTGIRTTHNLFGGRASGGFTSISDGNGTTDCNGHGSHVAGTVGSSTYGVAKNVDLVAVRVLDCSGSGSFSGVIAGIDWVTANHVSPAVANMSLGGGISTATDNAVNAAVAAGVTMVVAAGNNNADACGFSPARAVNAITVGSTTSSDSRSSFSNYGSCLDIYAPGSSITSTWSTSNSATNTISGTSMASPHVAGVAALYLDANPNATPAQVQTAIENAAGVGKVSDAKKGSPNLLLNNNFNIEDPDQYDDVAIRGYTDDVDGDAVSWPGGANTVHDHNFHDSGDTDWTMVWISTTDTVEFSTNMVGSNSDTKIEVYKFTNVSVNPSYPKTNRFIINSKILVGSDNGAGDSSVTVNVDAGFLYAVKVQSRIGNFGTGTDYEVRIKSIDNPPDQYDDLTIRGYTDDYEGDAVSWPGGANTVQNHNFHDSGDTDWTMVWIPTSGTTEFSTNMVGSNSDTKIEVYKFTNVSANPNYPNTNR